MSDLEIKNSNEGIKMLCSFLIGIVLAGLAAFIGYPHDLSTKSDVAFLQETTQKQLDIMQSKNDLEKDEIAMLRVDIAEIKAKLNIAPR